MERLIGLFGLIFFLFIAWALSENRKKIDRRLVAYGISLQFAFAFIILKTGPGMVFFDAARLVMTKILDFTSYGAGFLFGSLSSDPSFGAIVAFKVLPTVVFVSSLMGVLVYLRVVQAVVRAISLVMERTMRVSGAEGFIATSFIFMGIEAITGVRDYIGRMTRSELFTLMVSFMSTIAGSVMAAYVSFGASAGHLLAASVMSAPAAIVLSKIMIPETGKPETGVSFKSGYKSEDVNVIEAAANGAYEGLKLAATIGAVLLAFVSLIGMLDYLLGFTGTSFESLSSYFFSPVAFIMGVPWGESFEVGKLLGIKIVFNEFISYGRLQGLIDAGKLSPHSTVIVTYALCSFASFSSIAVLLGSIGVVASNRKKEAARLSLKALIAGNMAGFMTATIAGLIL